MGAFLTKTVIWILLATGLYLVWAAALYLGQRNLLFVGRTLPAPSRPSPGQGVETWTLSTSFGEVEAWYHPPSPETGGAPGEGRSPGEEGLSPGQAGPPGEERSPPGAASGAPPRPTRPAAAVLFAHGNGERIDDWAGAYRSLADRGVAVLLVEYPGYGRSGGAPSEVSVTETMIAAFDRLAERPEVDPDRIVGLGRSLGGGAVAVLSRHRPLRALVLQSTFTSVRAFAGRYLLPPFLVRDPFDALGAVRDYAGPVLVAHGRSDPVIPYRHGRRLAAASPRAILRTWPCAHNDCPPDWDAWIDDLVGFLAEHGIVPGAREA